MLILQHTNLYAIKKHTHKEKGGKKERETAHCFIFSCGSLSLTNADEARIYFCAIWYGVKDQLQEEQ